jgi:N-acetylmuramoyl-L-alanine amidase/Putative peptidoglycan binding domain
MPLSLPPLKWVPSPNYSSRGGQKVRLIITHSCEGNYTGSISWFATARSQVSAHYVLKEDGTECTMTVRPSNKAWACCSFNPVSESIEMAGYEDKGFSDAALNAHASIVAFRLHSNGLPARFAEKGEGEGFCRHLDLGAAGGGHVDWTQSDSVWNAFVAKVQAAYAQPMPDSWPIAGNQLPPPMPPGYTPTPDVRTDEPVGSIAWAQMRLNALGAARPALVVDGIDGSATERAIVAFQSLKGIYRDGVLGPNTIKALAA